MWTQLCKWLLENYPLIFSALVLIAIVWIVAKFYYQRFKEIETKVSHLPCAERSEQYKLIREELVQIKTFLMVKNPKTAVVFSEKHSPRRLNEEGQKLLQDVSGESFLDANNSSFLSAILKKNPKTALDVEVNAHEVLIEALNTEIFNGIKNWVYNSPTRRMVINGEETDYTITLEDVCFVLSLPLRDRYLNMHPEITQ